MQMSKFFDMVIGDLNEKKRYKEHEKRAKALPAEYAKAYKNMRDYIWSTSGLLTIEPLISLVDLLEEAAASGRKVTDITGPDVAAFADELVRGEKSYKDQQRQKLNEKLNSQDN
jgi:DNA-binding ferritin-like protein (Dps family)